MAPVRYHGKQNWHIWESGDPSVFILGKSDIRPASLGHSYFLYGKIHDHRIIPSGYAKKALEHGHGNSVFTHERS
jgi:hypothetical protein